MKECLFDPPFIVSFRLPRLGLSEGMAQQFG